MLNSKKFSDTYYSNLLHARDTYNPGKMISVNKCISLLPKSGKILDVGCFNGFVLDLCKNKGYETYGVDASKEGVELSTSKGHKVLEANLEENIPFDDNYFDAVLGLEIIEHLADTDSFLKNIKRVLKPNGVLIFATPNFFSLSRRVMTLIGINPYFEASFSFPPKMAGHLRFYTHKLLEDFLEFHGFEVVYSGSDLVNFNSSGNLFSTKLAELFPRIGRGVIIKAQNIK